ncbi:MAG: rhodanese-like domain-containing protein [Candidatus Dependentiae bacterium]
MKMLQFFLICLLIVPIHIITKECKTLSPALFQVLEDVIDDIYHLDTNEVQEIVQQDFGCIPEISADDLKAKMAASQDLLVINVLSEKWYQDCHIAGSINVPLDKLIYEMQDWDRSTDIVVYCALDACDAGEKAYILLRCMGFEHVVDYPGGIKDWFQLGYPIQGPCASEYLHDQECNRCLFEWAFDDAFKSMLQKTRYMRCFKSRCGQ